MHTCTHIHACCRCTQRCQLFSLLLLLLLSLASTFGCFVVLLYIVDGRMDVDRLDSGISGSTM